MSVTQAEIETDDSVVLPVEAIHAATGRGSVERVSFITEPGSTASQADDDDSLNASAAALSGLSAESSSSSKGGTGTSNGSSSGAGTDSGSKSKSTSDPPASGVSSLTNTAAPDAIPPPTTTSLASQDSWSGMGGIERHQPKDEEAAVDYGYENVNSSMGNNSGLSSSSSGSVQRRGAPAGKTMLEVWRSGRRLSDGASRTFQRSYSQRANSMRSLASDVIQEDSFNEADIDDKALPVWKRTVRNCRSSQTYISCLIDDLQWALMSLNSSRSQDLQHLEDMAIFIHDSQSVESRLYHNIARVFEVTGGASPIQLLAAFFRDTVHHFIDGEITTLVLQKMSSLQRHAFVPNTFQVNPDLFQHNENEEDDAQSTSATTASSSSINKTMKLTRMVVKLFGYQPNLDLETFYQWKHGMDVFLSCLVAVQYLQDSLNLKQLAELITCFEGTIHFRPPDPTSGSGYTAIEQLFHRLTAVNTEFKLELTETEMELACQQSADLHNRLLGSFVTHDPRTFLDHTWSLLPEQNINLRKTYLYSLNDFYSAVKKMKDFMVNSKTLVMYSSFRGIPPTWEMEEFQRLFQNNHDLGLAYLSSMLCGVGIIVAFATLTGGADVPKSLFFGDLQSRSSSSQDEEKDQQLQQGPDISTSVRINAFCLGDGLPRLMNVADDCKPQIYDILKEGRQGESTFDHRNAPISAYVYGTLGEREQNAVLGHCIYPMTKESSWELLERLPMDLTKAIAREVANVAVSRTHLVYNVLMELTQRHNFNEMPQQQR